MIGEPSLVLAPFADSAQSLGPSPSSLYRVLRQSSPINRRRPFSSRPKPLLHPPESQLSRRIRLDKPQKAIQYPETRSGSVQ